MSRGQFSFDYREAGQAALEFSIAALTLLLAAWALYEGMLWHRQRQILHLALLDAARAASFSHIHPQTMARALEAGLKALPHDDQDRLAAQDLRRWRLEVLQPGEAHYRRHGRQLRGLPSPAIRNDYQAEQQAARPGSPSIHEANMLRLRLTYASAPATPFLAALLPALAGLTADPCRRALLAAGWLPLRLELTLEMHSHAVRWPDSAGVNTRSRPCG
ncbi:hypothetical protein [Bordetella avium]|uniref:hypothetical protein n=1 Tax=Bordetella avium TaxID=521 RepID=UPI000E67C72C|nr:hypothetical protein [Bordetella avium]AZY52039.1 hypothetical protein C0J07_05595 [Bordetella avium]RIQ16959.1 hypothetical protein D0850_11770 [Bordetella avium]RIQ36315.1 hypothetical protein D0849_01155 [Bordetella avium]RIQ73128.1 hypothetical protein D0839_01995 [Bordetella avium]